MAKLGQGLNKIERLSKTALDGLKTARLNFDTRGAEQQVARLQRGIRGLSQTVRVRVVESVERQQQQGSSGAVVVGGGGGRSPLSNLAAGAAAQAVAQQRQIQPPAQALREINTRADAAQARISEEIAAAYNTRAAALAKVDDQNRKVAEAQRQLNLAEAGFADKGKSVAQTVNNKRNSLQGLTNWLGRYREQLRVADDDLGRLVTFQDRLTEALNRTSAAADGANRRLQMQGKNAELARTGGLTFDERLAQRREKNRNRGNAGRAAAAGVGAVGLSIPGLDAVVGGAGLGFAAGGPAGAAIGAAAAGITALGAASVKTGGQIAVFYSEVSRARIALAGISPDAADYQQSLRGIDDVVARLNLPLKETTENFTRLRAATAAVGLDADKTVSIFRSLASANAALGGNSERLNGILLATTQIFSKGKVSAEELRGQLGERLAGAFADFAKATGKSTAELDAALEKGEVSLKDFVDFADFAGRKYGKSAELMAASSESAGDRLKVAWEKLQLKLGPILQSLGANIQNFATKAINALTPLVEKLEGVGRYFLNNRLYQIEKVDLPAANRQLQTVLNDPAGPNNPINKQALQSQRAFIQNLKDEAKGLREMLYPQAKPVATGGTKLPKPDLGLTPAGESEEDRRRKLEKEAQIRSQLRQLAIQQVEADTARGLIGKDRLSQLEGEAQAMKQILGMTLADIRADGGPLKDARSQLAIAEYQRGIAELNQEAVGIQEEINAAGLEASKLRQELLGGQLSVTESPLQTAVREVKQELQAADQQALELYKRIEQLGGANSAETAQAMKAVGNLRGDIAETDPLKLASQRLTQGDTETLEEQIRLLQRGAVELSTLDQLIIKYGKDWEKLDPSVKGHLVDLARQRDALQEIYDQQKAQQDLYNGIGDTLRNGLVDGLVLAVSGTEKLGDAMRNLASDILSAIGKALILNAITSGINGLAGKDGVGFFSILAGSFGKRAAGGPVAPGGAYLVGEQGPELLTLRPNGGGFVTNANDTRALLGDQREPMSGAMARYSPSNARSLVSSTDDGSSAVTYSPTIQATRMADGQEWVTVEQMNATVQQGMAAAAHQGASGGHARVMGDLRNKRSVRARLAL